VKAGMYRDCDWQIVDRLKAIAGGRGIKPTQVALLWLWSKTYMAAPIIGATSLDQLDDAARASELAPLSAEEIASLEELYQFRAPAV
jgi:aryl-alcohol dehydrogenase-like predicted oxidoreductase